MQGSWCDGTWCRRFSGHSTTAPVTAAGCANAAKPLSKQLLCLQLSRKRHKKSAHSPVSIDPAEVTTADTHWEKDVLHKYRCGTTPLETLVFLWTKTHVCSGEAPLQSHPPMDPPLAAPNSALAPSAPGSRASLDCSSPACSLQACSRALGDKHAAFQALWLSKKVQDSFRSKQQWTPFCVRLF